MLDALRDFLWSFMYTNLVGFDNMITDAEQVLLGTGSGFNINTVWSHALTISNSLKPFCSIVIAICLLLEIAQVAMKVDVLKFEHGVKLCIKMVLAKVCIDIAPTFLKACYNQSVLWISDVMATGPYQNLASMVTGPLQQKLESVTGWDAILGMFVSNLIVFIAIRICGLIVEAIAFGRLFEIFIYLAVSPLPCAFFPLGDGHGGGFSRVTQRFFKSFIAVCLQGVMIVVCIRIFYMIMGSTLSSLIADAIVLESGAAITDLSYTFLMGAVVLALSVGKCGSMAKAIIDAM